VSCYNWEQGSLKIPSGEWKPLRDALIAHENKRREKLLAKALRIYAALTPELLKRAREHVKAWNKTQQKKDHVPLRSVTLLGVFSHAQDPDWGPLTRALRGFDDRSLRVTPCRTGLFRSDLWGRTLIEDENEDDDVEVVKWTLFPYENGKHHVKPLKPKRSKGPLARLTASKVKILDVGGEASIIFDAKNKTLTWSVSENNRAVERAHRHILARVLFSLLREIKWTRGSGGTIVGNDEYSRCSYAEGEGGNYTKYSFGPAGSGRKTRFRRA